MPTAEEVEEITSKLDRMRRDRDTATWRSMFAEFAGPDGVIDSDELTEVLRSAGIGNMFTRDMYVDAIMGVLDTNMDGQISLIEFEGMLERPSTRQAVVRKMN